MCVCVCAHLEECRLFPGEGGSGRGGGARHSCSPLGARSSPATLLPIAGPGSETPVEEWKSNGAHLSRLSRLLDLKKKKKKWWVCHTPRSVGVGGRSCVVGFVAACVEINEMPPKTATHERLLAHSPRLFSAVAIGDPRCGEPPTPKPLPAFFQPRAEGTIG